jgi:hypothetical protein
MVELDALLCLVYKFIMHTKKWVFFADLLT